MMRPHVGCEWGPKANIPVRKACLGVTLLSSPAEKAKCLEAAEGQQWDLASRGGGQGGRDGSAVTLAITSRPQGSGSWALVHCPSC